MDNEILPGAPHGVFIVLESEVVLAMSLCVASNFIERLVAVQEAMDAAFAKANRESKTHTVILLALETCRASPQKVRL